MRIELLDDVTYGRIDIYSKEGNLHCVPMKYLRKSYPKPYMHSGGYFFYLDTEGNHKVGYAVEIYDDVCTRHDIEKIFVPELLDMGLSNDFMDTFEFGKQTETGMLFLELLSICESTANPVLRTIIPLSVVESATPESIEPIATPDLIEPTEHIAPIDNVGVADTADEREPLETVETPASIESIDTPEPANPKSLEDLLEPKSETVEPIEKTEFVSVEPLDTNESVSDEPSVTDEPVESVSIGEPTEILSTDEPTEPEEGISEEQPTPFSEEEQEMVEPVVVTVDYREEDKTVTPTESPEPDTLPWFFQSFPEEIEPTVEKEETQPSELAFDAELNFGGQSVDEVLSEVQEKVEREIENRKEYPYHINRKGSLAEGIFVGDREFKVYKGARVCPECTESCLPKIKHRREEALQDGELYDNHTTEDIIFPTANDASGFVLGSNPGSLQNWHTINGLTVREVSQGITPPERESLAQKRDMLFTMKRNGRVAYMYYDEKTKNYWALDGSELAPTVPDVTPKDLQETRHIYRHIITEDNILTTSVRFMTYSQVTSFVTGQTGVKPTNWKNQMGMRLPDVIKD